MGVTGEERVLIDGELRTARAGRTFETINPATEEVLGVAADCDLADLDDAIGAAAGELIGMGPLPGQCGVIVSHGRRVVAADVFANADMFACQWEAIVRSALFDAPGEVRGTPSATKALQFLRRFAGGKSDLAPGVGLGREHHVSGKRVVGQALVWDDVLVHASAFTVAA